MNIPSYSDWLNNTSGGFLSIRGPKLKALDELIRQQRRANDPALRDALSDYLAHEDVGNRNRTLMIDRLISAVGLDKGFGDGLDSNFGVINLDSPSGQLSWDSIPVVIEPPSPIPIPVSPQVDIPLDPWLQSDVENVFTVEITPADKARPVVDIQARREVKVNTLATKLTSMNSDLMQLEVEIRFKLLLGCQYFTLALHQGMEKFKELHRLDAQDKMFKVTIVKGIFGVLESLPFPLSALGKAGGAIAGLAQVDTDWAGFKVTLPTPSGIKDRVIDAAATTFRNYSTINVQTSQLANHADTMVSFINDFDSYADVVINQLKAERSVIDNDSKRSSFARKLSTKLQSIDNVRQMGIPLGECLAKIDKLVRGINRQFDPLRRMPPVDVKEAQYWVTVQLIADYAMTGLCDNENTPIKAMAPKDLGGKVFGESFINFLASKEIGVLKIRETSFSSEAIYQGGQIPWDNRYYDVIALMLFLEWFQRKINPFDLLRPGFTAERIRGDISSYIRQLGIAMKAHATTTTLGYKIASSVEGVHTQVGR